MPDHSHTIIGRFDYNVLHPSAKRCINGLAEAGRNLEKISH